jgi:hypothetical protein
MEIFLNGMLQGILPFSVYTLALNKNPMLEGPMVVPGNSQYFYQIANPMKGQEFKPWITSNWTGPAPTIQMAMQNQKAIVTFKNAAATGFLEVPGTTLKLDITVIGFEFTTFTATASQPDKDAVKIEKENTFGQYQVPMNKPQNYVSNYNPGSAANEFTFSGGTSGKEPKILIGPPRLRGTKLGSPDYYTMDSAAEGKFLIPAGKEKLSSEIHLGYIQTLQTTGVANYKGNRERLLFIAGKKAVIGADGLEMPDWLVVRDGGQRTLLASILNAEFVNNAGTPTSLVANGWEKAKNALGADDPWFQWPYYPGLNGETWYPKSTPTTSFSLVLKDNPATSVPAFFDGLDKNPATPLTQASRTTNFRMTISAQTRASAETGAPQHFFIQRLRPWSQTEALTNGGTTGKVLVGQDPDKMLNVPLEITGLNNVPGNLAIYYPFATWPV